MGPGCPPVPLGLPSGLPSRPRWTLMGARASTEEPIKLTPAIHSYPPTCPTGLPASPTYLPTHLSYQPTCLPTNPAHPFPLPTNYLLTRLLLVAKSLSTRDPTYCRPHRTLAVSPVEHSGQSVSVCKARSRPAGRALSVFKNFPRTLFPGLTCTGRKIELGDFLA